MEEDIYFKLGERLNQFQLKMLLIEPFMKILREFYTEEQAKLGAELPLDAHTAPELAGLLNRDEKELTDLLEDMANNGLVYDAIDDNGINKYALSPFVPGVVELQLMRGNDTPHDRKVAKMLEEFTEGEMADLMREVFKNPELVKQMIPSPPVRTITVEQELPLNIEIYPYEKLSEMIDREDSFAVAKCYCRHHAYLADRPCKIEGIPEYSCLTIGKPSDYIVNRKFGKRISKEEAKEIIEATEKAGLVHNVNNFIENTVFVCNCCGCCCGFIENIKKFNTNALLAYSNFKSTIDKDSCSGCGDCIDRCQMDALSMDGKVVSINEKICIGCGNCISICPSESLSMVRRTNEKPPNIDKKLEGMGIGGM